MLNNKRSREIKSCCATRWNNNKGLWNRNHPSCSRRPVSWFSFTFLSCGQWLYSFRHAIVFLYFCFKTLLKSLHLVQKRDSLELRGKKSDSRIQHEFSDLPTWLKTPKQRPCVAEDEDETANQQKDMVSGYNGCMCFSGMLWGPSALNVKHEWNSQC